MSVTTFLQLLEARGTRLLISRSNQGVVCPCRTPEGFRDPIWHLENPSEPVCDEEGYLSEGSPIRDNHEIRAFIQPVQSSRATRLSTERLIQLFGEIQADDHLCIMPVTWGGWTVDIDNWGRGGDDVIKDIQLDAYYMLVNFNYIYDPTTRDVLHHIEVGLRLIREPLITV
jgi:hypothetical protein